LATVRPVAFAFSNMIRFTLMKSERLVNISFIVTALDFGSRSKEHALCVEDNDFYLLRISKIMSANLAINILNKYEKNENIHKK
jgi:hypothetical protein